MAGDVERFEPTGRGPKQGVFGDRLVHGMQFQIQGGGIAWHISTWPKEGSTIDDYWFRNSEFFEIVRADYAVNLRAENHFLIGQRVTGIESGKEKSMRDAMAEWERDATEEPRT
jgi:hypothetical protein